MPILEEIDTPVLVEPSMLYCKYGRKICCHYRTSYKICGLKDQHILWEDNHRAPDWCPLKFNALFPG